MLLFDQTMLHKLKLLFTFAALCLLSINTQADCRGCCSRHKGVVCIDGVTKCRDGSSLSAKCKAKGCSKCAGEQTQQATQAAPEAALGAYNRKDWPHWVDIDNDCQDTRSEILQRDNIGTIKFKRNRGCSVSWGKWVCPYTGKTFTKASDMDIDHIVPLSHAHKTGGANWTREKKRAFANDPMNLLTTEDNINQEKGDKGPDEWKPPQKSYWATYAGKWRAVKKKYGLVVSGAEEKALVDMAWAERPECINLDK